MNTVVERLAGVVEEFADLDGREKLELLVDYAASLPPLDPEHQVRKAAAEEPATRRASGLPPTWPPRPPP